MRVLCSQGFFRREENSGEMEIADVEIVGKQSRGHCLHARRANNSLVRW
jgi:hypothetical protein